MTPQPAQARRREGRLTRRLTWLAVALGILRSRRFQDRVIVDAIVLAALASLGRNARGRAFAGARAWLKRLDQRTEHAVTAAKRRPDQLPGG
jgi:hypothetical protein